MLLGLGLSMSRAAEADLAGLWKNTAVGISQSIIIVSQEGAFCMSRGTAFGREQDLECGTAREPSKDLG